MFGEERLGLEWALLVRFIFRRFLFTEDVLENLECIEDVGLSRFGWFGRNLFFKGKINGNPWDIRHETKRGLLKGITGALEIELGLVRLLEGLPPESGLPDDDPLGDDPPNPDHISNS